MRKKKKQKCSEKIRSVSQSFKSKCLCPSLLKDINSSVETNSNPFVAAGIASAANLLNLEYF